MMKKALIMVFSGTGNTLTVAGLIRDSLARRDIQADIYDIGDVPAAVSSMVGRGDVRSIGREMKNLPVDVQEYDLLLFGYPIYAFNAPHIFRKFLKVFTVSHALQAKTAVIFKVSGEPLSWNNASSHAVKKLLKDCTVVGDYHFLMPYNIVFRYPDSFVGQMYRYAEQYSEILADNMVKGKTSFIPYTVFHRFFSLIMRIQHFGAILNSRLYRVHHKTCTRCLKCVKGCPVGNISEKDGHFSFGSRCQMCMRCTFYCPEDAVRAGILDFWRVNGPYNFKKLAAEGTEEVGFTLPEQRKFFRMFRAYYEKLDRLIAENDLNG
jgi:NAD-dependent dihydropyrimidine dehydrogenase PreA subunit/menaquinone-dependent protoporphyrinogen IX oxidase